MTDGTSRPSFELKYYLYTATLSAGFVYPIATQYKLWRGLDYAAVGTVGAVFMGTWVVSEIPTGYLGDRLGRRTILLASSALNAVVLAGMAWVETFPGFALATFGWAVAFSMRSGAGSAWLYDLLRERLDEGEYARVRGNGMAVMLGVTAAASLVGGALAGVDYTYPFLLNGAWFGLGVGVLLTLPSDAAAEGDAEVVSPRAAAAAVRRVVSRPPLRSFVVYFGAFFAFFETIDLYIQPMATTVGFSRVELGVLYAGFYVVAAAVSRNTGRIQRWVGVRGWFLTAPFAVAAAFVGVAVVPLVAVPAFFVVKVANRTSTPLMQQYVNDHVDSTGRATGVSAVTMVGGMAAVFTRTAAGVVADAVGLLPMVSLLAAGLAVVLVTVAAVESPVPREYDGSAGASAAASDD